jgi:hypothetical protein
MAKDKYDRAISYLTDLPSEIFKAWSSTDHECHCLFAFVSPTGRVENEPVGNGKRIGCLTQIRASDHCVAWTDDLTRRIRADERIPLSGSDTTPEHLPVFAEWQRTIDRELGRGEP